jgi:glycerate 2-kinase
MSIIKNKEELATTPLRRDALEILEAGLQAIDTEKILRKKIRIENENLIVQGGINTESTVVPLPLTRRGVRGEVYFVGIGKCALDGAKVMEDILGDYLTAGAVIDVKPVDEALGLNKVKYFEGTHPLPSEQNVEATKQILEMVSNLTENDLVITLISGGGSSLFELPMPGISLDDIIEKTMELTTRGADIYELNAARKEKSAVKGGKFAEHCFPAKVVSLIFSDVLGNDISVIASGPTVLDKSTEKVKNILLASNHDALVAMKTKAEELGFNTIIETEKLSGNAAEMGKELAVRESKPKSCILFGGETTVRVPQNPGIGGRNQEMALSALLQIPPDSILVCAASDGHDNTDHAGAIADTELLQKAKKLNFVPEEFLMHGDSYNFFKQVADGAIYTDKLGSNVSDLYIMLYK